MENRQARGQVLVIRRVAGDKIRRRLDDGFMNIGGFDAVVELNVRTQLYLGDGDVMQTFRSPVQNTMNFIQVNAFLAAISFCYQQTLIHG